jgi:hypothetical protein
METRQHRRWIRHPQTMKIANPPSPPFSKGGLGGFGSYFLSNSKLKIHNSKLINLLLWLLENRNTAALNNSITHYLITLLPKCPSNLITSMLSS